MKYMGDYPSRQVVPASDLSDQIFEPALKEVNIILLIAIINYWCHSSEVTVAVMCFLCNFRIILCFFALCFHLGLFDLKYFWALALPKWSCYLNKRFRSQCLTSMIKNSLESWTSFIILIIMMAVYQLFRMDWITLDFC